MSLSTARKIKLSAISFAKLLQEHHSDLRGSLNIPALIPLLRKQELLTVEEWEEIGKLTRAQKIDQLIQILPQKGEQAYLKFISCLESENEHPAHKELADKLKKTRSRCRQQKIRKSTTPADSDVTKTDLKETITIKLMEQVTELLQSGLVGVDDLIQGFEETIASLQAQLAEKERIIAELSQGSTEVTKFQQLLNYANSSHDSQPSLHYNMRLLAKYYHDTRKVLKTVKLFLKRDNNLVNQYLDAASEDSDSVRSRASSMDSDWQLKIQKPCSKQSIEEENELAEEENEPAGEENEPAGEENEPTDQSSLSSADETDDEGLNDATQDEHQLQHKCVKALQRPVSWPAYPKKKKASKTISNPTSSTVQVKRDCPTDNNANEDNQVLKPSITVVEENENDVNEDTSIACASVDQPIMEDQEESSSTVFAGYLQKEGNSEMWRKRYFTLTKEFLFYSKSEQDSTPLGLIPLIDLALERKRKTSIELINKRTSTSLIKVKKPGKKSVQSYKVLRLKASNEAEAAQWIHNIEDAIATLRTQYSYL